MTIRSRRAAARAGEDQQPADTESAATMGKSEEDEPRRSRAGARNVARQAGAATNVVRSKVASLVRLVALLCAVVLALGAVLVALEANPDNTIVSFFDDLARRLDGPFANMFTFDGENAAKKQTLVNWGIGAAAYLVVGRILERIIRP